MDEGDERNGLLLYGLSSSQEQGLQSKSADIGGHYGDLGMTVQSRSNSSDESEQPLKSRSAELVWGFLSSVGSAAVKSVSSLGIRSVVNVAVALKPPPAHAMVEGNSSVPTTFIEVMNPVYAAAAATTPSLATVQLPQPTMPPHIMALSMLLGVDPAVLWALEKTLPSAETVGKLVTEMQKACPYDDATMLSADFMKMCWSSNIQLIWKAALDRLYHLLISSETLQYNAAEFLCDNGFGAFLNTYLHTNPVFMNYGVHVLTTELLDLFRNFGGSLAFLLFTAGYDENTIESDCSTPGKFIDVFYGKFGDKMARVLMLDSIPCKIEGSHFKVESRTGALYCLSHFADNFSRLVSLIMGITTLLSRHRNGVSVRRVAVGLSPLPPTRVVVQKTLVAPANAAHSGIFNLFVDEFQRRGLLKISAHTVYHVQTKHQYNIVQLYMFLCGRLELTSEKECAFFKSMADEFLARCNTHEPYRIENFFAGNGQTLPLTLVDAPVFPRAKTVVPPSRIGNI